MLVFIFAVLVVETTLAEEGSDFAKSSDLIRPRVFSGQLQKPILRKRKKVVCVPRRTIVFFVNGKKTCQGEHKGKPTITLEVVMDDACAAAVYRISFCGRKLEATRRAVSITRRCIRRKGMRCKGTAPKFLKCVRTVVRDCARGRVKKIFVGTAST